MTIRTKTVSYAGQTHSADFGVGKCWTENGAGVWVNETSDINNATASDVPLATTAGSAIYFGSAVPFEAFSSGSATGPAGGTSAWDYWNGAAWVTFVPGGAATLASGGTANWSAEALTGWAPTQVNGETDGPWYYVRRRVETTATTAGTLTTASLGIVRPLAVAVPVTITETTGRVIRSAVLRVWMQTSSLLAIDNLRVAARFGGAALADIATRWATVNQWTASESSGYLWDFDVTSLLSGSLGASGTSTTLHAQLSFVHRAAVGALLIASVSSELLITYTADDADAVQMSTVYLPIESIDGTLTTTLSNIGGSNVIPQLTGAGGILPEAGITIRDVYLVLLANTAEAGTADYALALAIDGEGETTIASFDAANNSDAFARIVWDRSDLAAGSAHNLQGRTTNTAGAVFAHLGGYIAVTYSYTVSGTTRRAITKRYLQTLSDTTGPTAADQGVGTLQFRVQGLNPSLIRAGVQIYGYQSADPGSLILQCGGAAARSYSVPPDATAGPVTVMHRFDAGGIAGAGLTLARGVNTMSVTTRYDTTPVNGGGLHGDFIVTFAYDVTAGRSESAAYFPVLTTQAFGVDSGLVAVTARAHIPEEAYYLDGVGLQMVNNSPDTFCASRLRIRRGENLGYVRLPYPPLGLDVFIGARPTCVDASEIVLRYKGSPAGGLDFVAGSLPGVVDGNGTSRGTNAGLWCCWHDYSYTTTIDVDDYLGGDGSGLTVNAHRADTGELVATGTTAAGGTVALVGYDNTADHYAVCIKDGDEAGATVRFRWGD